MSEVAAVEDLHVGPDTVAYTTTSVYERPRRHAALAWTGNLPVRAAKALEHAGYDLRTIVDAPAVADRSGWADVARVTGEETPAW